MVQRQCWAAHLPGLLKKVPWSKAYRERERPWSRYVGPLCLAPLGPLTVIWQHLMADSGRGTSILDYGVFNGKIGKFSTPTMWSQAIMQQHYDLAETWLQPYPPAQHQVSTSVPRKKIQALCSICWLYSLAAGFHGVLKEDNNFSGEPTHRGIVFNKLMLSSQMSENYFFLSKEH